MQHNITTSQRKLLLLSPGPLFFMATLAFWVLGGGQSSSNAKLSMLHNLNLQASATNPEQTAEKNKLSYYKKPDTKKGSWSTKTQKNPLLNSYVKKSNMSLNIPEDHNIQRTPRIMGAYEMAEREVQLPHKLQTLRQLVRHNDPVQNTISKEDKSFKATQESNFDLKRLKEIMIRISNPQTKDSELTQLNDELERVLDIQHSRRVATRFEASKNKVSSVQHTSVVSSTSVALGYYPNPLVYQIDTPKRWVAQFKKGHYKQNKLYENIKKSFAKINCENLKKQRITGITFSLKAPFSTEQFLWCSLEIRNNSMVSYTIENKRFFMVEHKKVKRSSFEKIKPYPPQTYTELNKIPP